MEKACLVLKRPSRSQWMHSSLLRFLKVLFGVDSTNVRDLVLKQASRTTCEIHHRSNNLLRSMCSKPCCAIEWIGPYIVVNLVKDANSLCRLLVNWLWLKSRCSTSCLTCPPILCFRYISSEGVVRPNRCIRNRRVSTKGMAWFLRRRCHSSPFKKTEMEISIKYASVAWFMSES